MRRLALVGMLWLAIPAVAQARTELPYVPESGGHVAAGDSLVRSVTDARGRHPGLELLTPDGGRRRVFSVPPPGDESGSVRLAAAATADRLAIGAFDEASGLGLSSTKRAELFTGPLAGPYERVFACEPENGELGFFDAPAIDGAVVALADCTFRGIFVHDGAASPPAGRTLPVAGDPDASRQVAVGGRHVAWVWHASGSAPAPLRVTVHDLDAGRAVTDVALPRSAIGDVPRIAVQADGTLAALWSTGRASRCTLGIWRPGGTPVAHGLPQPHCHALELRDGTLVYVRRATNRLVVAAAGGGSLRSVTNTPSARPWGFDGRRVVWEEPTCTGSSAMFAADLSETPPPATTCPVRVAPGTVRADRRGWIRIRLTCPKGCHGSVTLVASVVRGFPLGNFHAAPGGRATARVRLTPAQRRRLARRGRLRAGLTVTTLLGSHTVRRTVRR